MTIFERVESEISLLEDTIDGYVDHKDRPSHKSSSGGWRSAFFIIGVEVAERFAFYGISSNLITYLIGPLGESLSTAAKNVNNWMGIASLLPLLGAFLADSFFGRYYTIIVASIIYLSGLGLMTLSALLPSMRIFRCNYENNYVSCSKLQENLIFLALYLIAFGQGGHKPCVQAFGADQFDEQDPKERMTKSSFFNWWYFCLGSCGIVSVLIISYIEENFSWSMGFGIPFISMFLSIILFITGTKTYRFNVNKDKRNPFLRIGGVFIAAIRNHRHHDHDHDPSPVFVEEFSSTNLQQKHFEQYKFLNKALIPRNGSNKYESVYTMNEVNEAKAILRLVPIWFTCLTYGILQAQIPTFFVKQGGTLDRSIVKGFILPAATLQSLISISIVVFIPIYDRVITPLARSFNRDQDCGITMLQRIGIGMFVSILCMLVAALVELKRLKVVTQYDMVDTPNATIPMKVWWLIPQNVLWGIADVFTMVGMQEFFYSQVPNELRSAGLSLYLSITGVGSFLSSFLISVIDKMTNGHGRDGWFANNLNKGHIDYFYWLLAGISTIALLVHVYFARSYIYIKRNKI